MRSIDPARMSQPERLAELGEVLAAGIQRLAAKNIKPISAPTSTSNPEEQLDAAAAAEAPCGSPIEVSA